MLVVSIGIFQSVAGLLLAILQAGYGPPCPLITLVHHLLISTLAVDVALPRCTFTPVAT